jgi:hypothetical protein
VLGALSAKIVVVKTARVKQRAITDVSVPPAENNASVFWGGGVVGRAHERCEGHVGLEGLGEVLGAFKADVVGMKTVREGGKEKQRASVSAPPADNKSALSATYLSVFSTELHAMHAAMTMPLATLRLLLCESMFSTGLTPLSSKMGSAWQSILQSRGGNHVSAPPADNKASAFCYCGEASAHLRVVNALLILRASPMCWAPLSPMLLSRRLRGSNKEQPSGTALGRRIERWPQRPMSPGFRVPSQTCPRMVRVPSRTPDMKRFAVGNRAQVG